MQVDDATAWAWDFHTGEELDALGTLQTCSLHRAYTLFQPLAALTSLNYVTKNQLEASYATTGWPL